MSQVSRKTPKRCQRDHRARNRVTDFFVDYISWSGRDLPAPRDVLLRSPANPSCPAYCSQVWDFSWGHLANNVNIIMITWSRSFFYSVNLAVQKVKTRERTKTDGIIPQLHSCTTVLYRNTDLPSYYHSFVAVTGVNPLSQWRGVQTALKDIRAQRALPALSLIVPASTNLQRAGIFPFGDEVPVPQSSSIRIPTGIHYCWSAPYLTL